MADVIPLPNFPRGAIVRQHGTGPNMLVVRCLGPETFVVFCAGPKDGELRALPFPTTTLHLVLEANQ